MKANTIIENVQTTLLDPAGQYWPPSELLSYINEAQRQIANFKPEANSVSEDMKLTKGVTQALPKGASRLIDVTRNAEGNAITPVDQRDLDRMCPDWPTQTTTDTIEHYMYDDRAPTTFSVYPPAVKDTKVTVIYAATIESLTSTSGTLSLPDQYESAVIEYVLYRAHTKDTTAAVPQRAVAHYNQFTQMLGVQAKMEQAVTAGEPDQTNPRELR